MRTAFCFVLLAAVLPLDAQPKWKKASSEHFELYTTAADGQARRTLRYYEGLHAFFTEIVGDAEPSSKVVIVGFRNQRDYEPYQPNDFTKAYYLGGYQRDYIVMSELTPEVLPTAAHEYFHAAAHRAGLRLPLWLSEGLAALYSTLVERGDRMLMGNLICDRMEVLNRGIWLPLEEVLAAQHGSEHLDRRYEAGVLYAQSWALVHMLSLSEEFQPRFGDLLHAVLDGVEPAAAFGSVYGLSLIEVEERLRAYLRLALFNGAEFEVRVDRAAKPAIGPAPAAEIEPILDRLSDPLGGDDSQSTPAAQASAERFVNAVGLRLDGVHLRPAIRADVCEVEPAESRLDALRPPRTRR